MKSWLVVVLAVLFLCGCKKEKDVKPQPIKDDSNSGSELMNSSSRFSGTLEGGDVLYTEGPSISNYYGSTRTGSSNIYQSSLFHTSLKNLIVLNKGSLNFSGQLPSNEDFKNFFSPGAVPFSKQAINGVEIIWYDISGNAWSTSDGTGIQTGSTFRITEVKGVTMQSNYYVKIVAKFNCTLYNGSESKQLTDGVFVGLIGNM